MAEKETFYLVWALNGEKPMYKHNDLGSARREAERLAREVPGTEFVVLQSITGHRVPPPPAVETITYDPIPF